MDRVDPAVAELLRSMAARIASPLFTEPITGTARVASPDELRQRLQCIPIAGLAVGEGELRGFAGADVAQEYREPSGDMRVDAEPQPTLQWRTVEFDRARPAIRHRRR